MAELVRKGWYEVGRWDGGSLLRSRRRWTRKPVSVAAKRTRKNPKNETPTMEAVVQVFASTAVDVVAWAGAVSMGVGAIVA